MVIMVINGVFSSEGGKLFYKPFIMFYCGLIHVHQDKSGKCWHAHRFGSPLAGSEPRLPRLYFISSCPFPAAGHVLEPGPRRGRVHVGGIEGDGGGGGDWWACWVVALAAAFSPPALSDELRLPSRT